MDSENKLKINFGYFHICVNAAKDPNAFVEATFLDVKELSLENDNFDSLEDLHDPEQAKELFKKKIRGSQDVIVRDYVVKEKENIILIKANEILDPIDQSSLGNFAKFELFSDSTSNASEQKDGKPKNEKLEGTIQEESEQLGQGNTEKAKLKYEADEIDPPNQLPILNKQKLHVIGDADTGVKIKVHDLKLGEFILTTDSVVINGVDLRVQGNGIKLNDKTIKLEKYNRCIESRKLSSRNAAYLLIVKGSAMSIDGIRADNIDDIRIYENVEFDIKIEDNTNGKKESEKDQFQSVEEYQKLKNLLISLFITLFVLTALPCAYIVCTNKCIDAKQSNGTSECQKAVKNNSSDNKNQTKSVATQESHVLKGTNIVPTNTENSSSAKELDSASLMSKQTIGQGGVLNHYHVAVFGENVTSNVLGKSDKNKPVQADNNLLIMIVAVLLYLSFYCIIAYLMLKVLHEFNRQGKMTRDMSGVLRALENEKNKDKRLAMQKKILDDMINTYLDKRTIED